MHLFTRLRIALFLIAASAASTSIRAQNKPENTAQAAPACLPAKQFKAVQIHGLWRVRFTPAPQGLPADATMRIERHAQFSESVAGFVSRELGPAAGSGHAARAQLAGDLEDGFLSLDESSNGISITGTWNGEIAETSCGTKITGTWKDTSSSAPPDAPDIPFTLERVPGW